MATAAAGVIELADETMANAARVHGIELGLDISQFDLLVSGGGGGLHGVRIAEKLGIRRIIVPQNAGVGSAVGFLRSPVAFEIALSVMECVSRIDASALAKRIEEALRAVRDVVGKAVAEDRIETEVRAEVRYLGQGLELTLPVDGKYGIAAALQRLEPEFTRRYAALVGFTLTGIAIELVSVSISAEERKDPPNPPPMKDGKPNAAPRQRQIYELSARKALTYREIDRSALSGRTLSGPAVVPEAQTTTLVRPGWGVRRLDQGHLILERENGS